MAYVYLKNHMQAFVPHTFSMDLSSHYQQWSILHNSGKHIVNQYRQCPSHTLHITFTLICNHNVNY
jgi:hypothetical protein